MFKQVIGLLIIIKFINQGKFKSTCWKLGIFACQKLVNFFLFSYVILLTSTVIETILYIFCATNTAYLDISFAKICLPDLEKQKQF